MPATIIAITTPNKKRAMQPHPHRFVLWTSFTREALLFFRLINAYSDSSLRVHAVVGSKISPGYRSLPPLLCSRHAICCLFKLTRPFCNSFKLSPKQRDPRQKIGRRIEPLHRAEGRKNLWKELSHFRHQTDPLLPLRRCSHLRSHPSAAFPPRSLFFSLVFLERGSFQETYRDLAWRPLGEALQDW